MRSPHKLAGELSRRRAQYTFLTLGAMNTADREQVERYYQSLGLIGSSRPNQALTRRKDGSMHVADLEEAIDDMLPEKGGIDFIETWVSVLMLTLGDGLKSHNAEATPLFEFARHVRNAFAHGGTFDVRHERCAAEFDGIVIDRSLNGTQIYDLVEVGDLLALVDAVIQDLRTRNP